MHCNGERTKLHMGHNVLLRFFFPINIHMFEAMYVCHIPEVCPGPNLPLEWKTLPIKWNDMDGARIRMKHVFLYMFTKHYKNHL